MELNDKTFRLDGENDKKLKLNIQPLLFFMVHEHGFNLIFVRKQEWCCECKINF